MTEKLILILKNNALLKIGMFMTFMSVITGMLGYVFQVVAGNILIPREFATFTASMGLISVCLAPLGTITMYLAREVAKISTTANLSSLPRLYYKSLNTVLIISFFAALLAFYFQGSLNAYLKYDGNYLSILLIGIISLSGLMAVNIGFLQGFKQFIWLASINSGQTIFKIFIVILFVSSLQLGIDGALVGVSAATLLAWSVGYFRITSRFNYNKLSNKKEKKETARLGSLMPVILANVSFALMTQADVVMVNYYFPAEIASEYAAAAILGKAVLYLPGGLVLALLPMVAERHAKSEDSVQMVVQAALATLFLSAILSLTYYFFAQEIMQFLFQNKFVNGSQFLKYYGFAILPMAMVMVAEYFLIAMGKILFSWIFFIIAPFQILGVHYLHSDASSVILIVGLCCTIVMVIGYVLLWIDIKNKRY